MQIPGKKRSGGRAMPLRLAPSRESVHAKALSRKDAKVGCQAYDASLLLRIARALCIKA